MPHAKSTSQLLEDLKANEDLSIVRGLGSLAFVRAQGRTLEERSQERVLELLWAIRRELDSLVSREQFDASHHAWVERAVQILRTNRLGQLAYGQGQKTINVFLKFYVDWASRPTPEIAQRIRPWLHCPLDKASWRSFDRTIRRHGERGSGYRTIEDELRISNVRRWRASTSPLIGPGNPGFVISRLRSRSLSTRYGRSCGRCKQAIRDRDLADECRRR
jgi:hypothetical protein